MENKLKILQVKEEKLLQALEDTHTLESRIDNFEVIYEEPLHDYNPCRTCEYLECVYLRFAIAPPKDFKGRPFEGCVVAIAYDGVERYFLCTSFGFVELKNFARRNDEEVPKWFKVSFQWNEVNSDGFPVFGIDLVLANSKEGVEKHYSKYNWYSIKPADERDILSAEKRGMPIVRIKETKKEDKSFGIALMEKPLDEGLSLEETKMLFGKLHGIKGIPWEVQSENSSAMGFINLADAEIMDYDYDKKSEIYQKIREILDDMNKETDTGMYELQIGNNIIDVLITK